MCLILAGLAVHPQYPLVIAANRDEYYERPTAALSLWSDQPGILAGRDLRSGGTWMGITASGRFAAVTNYRDGRGPGTVGARSRGALVADYLTSSLSPEEYFEQLDGREFDGYNLLLGDPGGLCYASNRGASPTALEPGHYALSNGLLDAGWPKMEKGRQGLADALGASGDADTLEQQLLDLLSDPQQAGDTELPDTGVGTDLERLLSSIYIDSPSYGTRSSSVLMVDVEGRVRFVERQTHPELIEPVVNRFEFQVDGVG